MEVNYDITKKDLYEYLEKSSKFQMKDRNSSIFLEFFSFLANSRQISIFY